MTGCFSLEVFNTGSEKISGYECNMALYDKFLRRGKFLYVHGADDNHNKAPFGDLMCDSFGSWTQILAEELTYPAVIRALEEGRFYATTGPEITELTFDGSPCADRLQPGPADRRPRQPQAGQELLQPGRAAPSPTRSWTCRPSASTSISRSTRPMEKPPIPGRSGGQSLRNSLEKIIQNRINTNKTTKQKG